MALFKRKAKDSVLPEVDQYYQAEKRDRSGLAWLLALVSIAVVALVIVLLFLGGRWIYRQITDDNEPEVVNVGDDANDAPSFDGTDTNDDNQDNTTGDEPAPAPTTPAPSNENTNEGTVNAPAQTTTPSTTPRTGDDSSDELPNTGPGGMIGIFAGVTTLAGGIHYTVQRRKNTR